jgi:hypothetical protein
MNAITRHINVIDGAAYSFRQDFQLKKKKSLYKLKIIL